MDQIDVMPHNNITQRAHTQVELAPFFKLVKVQAEASCFIGNAELMVVYIADIDDHHFYLLTIMPGGGEQNGFVRSSAPLIGIA